MSENKFKKFLEARKWSDNLAFPFVYHAQEDDAFPNVESWDELKAHLDSHNAPDRVIAAAKYVWGLYIGKTD